MKKYIISILPIILIAVSFPRAQALAEGSSSIIVFSEDHIATPANNPAYDSLMVYSHRVDSLQFESEKVFQGKTQSDRMKYYGVLRDLAKAKSVYCQQISFRVQLILFLSAFYFSFQDSGYILNRCMSEKITKSG